MKFHVEIINSLNAGSVDNVHIYFMFEATDSVENMTKVWLPYKDQIKQMQDDNFTLNDGRAVQIFLGGDYHYLDDNVGHQGSSATYPSGLDKVTLNYLQNHGGSPHTPQHCEIELRTIEDYQQNYNENLSDDRSNHNMHENEKYHNSIAGPMLFPLKHLDQVVPASLDIMLGIVLLLYNLLLDKCKKIDFTENADKFAIEKESANQEWEISSLELSKVGKDLLEHGQNIIIMTNRLNRCQAMMDGNSNENLKLAAGSDTCRKAKKGRRDDGIERCAFEYCYVTKHDINVQWILCDHCNKWYHAMCDLLTPQEELDLSDVESYVSYLQGDK